MQQQWIVSQPNCNEPQKLDFYPTTGSDQLSGCIKRNPWTCTKTNVMVIVWWSAVSLIHYSFLNPSASITSEKYAQQIDEMHQKMQSLQPALVNKKGPIILHDNARPQVAQPCFRSFMHWATKFCLICCHIYLPSCQPLLQVSWQLSAQKLLPKPEWLRKGFPRVHGIPNQGFIH